MKLSLAKTTDRPAGSGEPLARKGLLGSWDKVESSVQRRWPFPPFAFKGAQLEALCVLPRGTAVPTDFLAHHRAH